MKPSKIKLLLFLLFVLHSPFITADDLSGIGFAKTDSEAKKEALADLSQIIKSEVRSNFESTSESQGVKGISSAKSNIKISSNLPILGAEFSLMTQYSNVEATVTLSPQKVRVIYAKELKKLKIEIASLSHELNKLDKHSKALKRSIYEDIYSLLKEYDRYESVANIIGVKEQKRPKITKAAVKVALAKLNSKIDSLAMATDIFSKKFTESKIFIYPPLLQHTTTASQFSAVFLQELKAKIHSVKSPKYADYLLTGEYTLTDKSIVLNYELLNTQTNEVKKSKTLIINEFAYKGLKIKPANIDFDALLNSGVISSSGLKVSLNSNRGSENLLFNRGEDIELFVKLNKMGYFYIVGYTQTNDGKLSYLLELQEGMGKSKFIKFVNADDASKWMSLGEFTVEKPFGIESLQVIASNRDITSLPLVKYDEESGYYIISNDIKKALRTTRGIKRKKSKKIEFSEDVMSFTTMKQ